MDFIADTFCLLVVWGLAGMFGVNVWWTITRGR